MTSNYHTPISTGAAVNAATVNNPLSQLDSQISGSFAGITHTVIDGMKLTWDSATSVTISEGVCYAQNGNLINAASPITKSGLSLSASTWYHIYVYLSGGTPAAEVVTTAPVAWKGTAYSKTGDTSRRYVGSIKTDGSGNIYGFLHNLFGNYIFYDGACNIAATPFRVLSAGTATTGTAVACSVPIPVTARIGQLRLINASDVVSDFGPTSSVLTLRLTAGSVTQQSQTIQAMLTANQEYYYRLLSAPGAGGAYIDVLAYQFNR